MNLYKILVKHLAPKDSHESVECYMIAENESELYDLLCEFTYWNEKDVECFCELHIPDFPESFTYEYCEKAMKEYIITTKGEIGSRWAGWDDLYYGKTHYGWELVKENISEEEIKVLTELNILKSD